MKKTIIYFLVLFAMLLSTGPVGAVDVVNKFFIGENGTRVPGDGFIVGKKMVLLTNGTTKLTTYWDTDYNGFYYVEGNVSLGEVKIDDTTKEINIVLGPNASLTIEKLVINTCGKDNEYILNVYRECPETGEFSSEGSFTIDELQHYHRDVGSIIISYTPELHVYGGIVSVGRFTNYHYYTDSSSPDVKVYLGTDNINVWSNKTSFSSPKTATASYVGTYTQIGGNKVYGAVPAPHVKLDLTGLLGLSGTDTPDMIESVTIDGSAVSLSTLKGSAGVEVTAAAHEIAMTFKGAFQRTRATIDVYNGSTKVQEGVSGTINLTCDAGNTYTIKVAGYEPHEFKFDDAVTAGTSETNRKTYNYVGSAVTPPYSADGYLLYDVTTSNTIQQSLLSSYFTVSGTTSSSTAGNYDITYTPKAGSPYYGEDAVTYYWTLVVPVAQIGETPYTTLAAAFSAATSGQTIKLLADCSSDNTIGVYAGSLSSGTAKENLTLDLNGKTFTSAGSPSGTFVLAHGSSLTITDTSTGANGKIIDNSGYGVVSNSDCVLTLEKGSIISNVDQGSAIQVCNTGKAIVKGGSVIADAGTGYGVYLFSGTENVVPTLDVQGGTIQSTNGYGILAHGKTEVTMSSGTINAAWGFWAQDNAKIAISGGTITTTEDIGRVVGDATVSISGGTFSKAVPQDYCAPGCTPKDNGDGTYTVEHGTVYTFAKGDLIYEGDPTQEPALSTILTDVSDVVYSRSETNVNKVSLTFNDKFSPAYARWTCKIGSMVIAPTAVEIDATNNKKVNFTFDAATVQSQVVTITLSGYGPHEVAVSASDRPYAEGVSYSLSLQKLTDDIGNVEISGDANIRTWLAENFEGDISSESFSTIGYHHCGTLTGKDGTVYHGASLEVGFTIYETSEKIGEAGWLNVGETDPVSSYLYYVGSNGANNALVLTNGQTLNSLFKIEFGAKAKKGDSYWGMENGGDMSVEITSLWPGLKIKKVVLTDSGSGNYGADHDKLSTSTSNGTGTFGYYTSYYSKYPNGSTTDYKKAKSLAWAGSNATDVKFVMDDAQRVHYIYIEYEKRNINDVTESGVTYTYNAVAQNAEKISTEDVAKKFEWTGSEIWPLAATNAVKDNVRTTNGSPASPYYLVANTDYELKVGSVENTTGVTTAQKDLGRYSTTFSANANSNVYYGTRTLSWVIIKSITNPFITIEVDPAVYTGVAYTEDEVKQKIHVYDRSGSSSDTKTELVEGVHYNVSFITGHTEFKEAETYVEEIVITGVEDYGLRGSRRINFTISPVEVITTRVKASVEYTGNAITMSDLVAPDPVPADFTGKLIVEGMTGTDDVTGQPIWKVLTYGTDYIAELVAQDGVTYKEAGLYPNALKIKAMEGGNYTSISNGNLIIWKSYDVTKSYAADFTVDEIPTQFIGGNHNEATPDVVLKDNNKQLTKDVDYTLTYADNTAQGVATITINALTAPLSDEFDTRIYRDSRELTFNISNLEFTENGITYIMTSGDAVAVKAVPGKDARVVVPETIEHIVVATPETKVTFTVKAINESGLSYPELISAILPATIETVQNGAFAQSSNVRWIDMQTAANFTPSTLERTIAAAPFAGVSKAALIFLNGTTVSGENYIYNTGSGLRCDELKIYEDMTGDQLGYADANGYKWGFENPYEFQANTVTNTRQLNAKNTDAKQQGYTLCLPYSLPIPEGIDAYVLSASKTDLLGFMPFPGNTLDALMPYVILPSVSGQLLSTTNATIAQTFDISTNNDITLPAVRSSAVSGEQDYQMGGVMRYMDGETCAASGIKTYIMQSGNVWRPIAGGSYTDADNKACILPMRAIIIPAQTAIGPHGAPALQSVFGMPGNSDMDIFEHIDIDAEDGQCFDLQGRPVATPDRGVYIRNGKKVVVK